MTVTRRRVLAIAASWAGAALVPGAAVARSHWQGRALGADASLVLDGPEDRAQAVLSDLRGLLEHVETQFSLHDPRSALARLNRTGVLHDPHPDFSALLDLAGRLHAATGGRYDPTVQPVWAALAEGRDPAAARASVGWYRVLRTPDAIRLGRGQALTLNGLAQGFATDLAAALLDRHGLQKGLINLGEYAARGGPWRIGVEDPDYGMVLTRTLNGTAIATSSPGALRFGSGQGHILDPHGAAPPVWSTVTVEAAHAAVADGLSTAACLADAQTLSRFMTRHAAVFGVTRLTAIDSDGNVRTF
ncbi:MAG: FAD:protein FMN transferase [Rhodobacteraceae bacterium]|nr:FAD:protein FMN transferase [Paracoccaceae bacterium]